MDHVGVGGHAGVGWVMQGWGGVSHAGVGLGRSCRGGVGWVMQGCSWVSHVGV